MNSRPDASWIARYFIDPPRPDRLEAAKLQIALGSAGGVLGLLALVIGEGGAAFLGFVLIVAGVVFAVAGYSEKKSYDAEYARTYPRPTDAEIDTIVGMDALSIMNRSLPQLGITSADLVGPRSAGEFGGAAFEQIAVLAQAGPASFSSSPGTNQMVVCGPALPCHTTIGDDGKLRYSRLSFMIICPTAYHLAVYRCVLDLYTGGLTEEQTSEFHYNDVVAVRTQAVALFPGGILMRPSQVDHLRVLDTVREMQIVVSSGDRVSIAMRVASSRETTVDANDPLDFPEVLTRVRAMLREKKGGTFVADEPY